MKGKAHRLTTKLALDLMEHLVGPTIFSDEKVAATIIAQSSDADSFDDVEFVDVWLGRDNPHKDEWLAIDDEASYSTVGNKHTGFNHFIDIAKGSGIYDDFDGYSYERGSGHVGERQPFLDEAEHQVGDWGGLLHLIKVTCPMTNLVTVDEALAWWMNDVYVHAPGHSWYRNCSPALARYSRFADEAGQKRFGTLEAEMKDRFPRATNIGGEGKGFPYSVFLPIDNVGRFWFDMCATSGMPGFMGIALHAIQDACIPHHAAGTNGNWHAPYEGLLKADVADWYDYQPEWPERALAYLEQWRQIDPSPPERLTLDDRDRVPALNWRFDHLVTWIALHAYHDYATFYDEFRPHGREQLHTDEGRRHRYELTVKTLAMSALGLLKVNEMADWSQLVGNRSTKELHQPDCLWAGRIHPKNVVKPLTLSGGLHAGYNGCHYCLPEQDEG